MDTFILQLRKYINIILKAKLYWKEADIAWLFTLLAYGIKLEDKWTVGFALMRLRKALGPIKAGRWIHVRCWFRKLKPPSKLGHPKFQRQSTETHPKPNHNRGRRFASAHPKTHVFFLCCRRLNATSLSLSLYICKPYSTLFSLVHFLPTSQVQPTPFSSPTNFTVFFLDHVSLQGQVPW